MPDTKTIKADVLIIGAGSTGMSAYKSARQFTDSILLIEEGHYGTSCARVGCMPSKLLIAAAEAAHHARHAGRFGVNVTGLKVDGKAVMARLRAERDRFVGFVVKDVDGWPDAHKIRSSARFVGPNRQILDDGTKIDAGRVVIATGSCPVWSAACQGAGDWGDCPPAMRVAS